MFKLKEYVKNFFVRYNKKFTIDNIKLRQIKNSKIIVEQICKNYLQKDLPKTRSI